MSSAGADSSPTAGSLTPERANSTSPADLGFPAVVNGVDFLASAITHLLASHDPRSLKYGVLHLQAAIEILVKVRLQREGFEHVFEDPYSADENRLRVGKFRSVTLDSALARLGKLAGIVVSKEERRALGRLSEERNKLQHFGSVSNHEVVNQLAGQALEVLSMFIVKHIVVDAPPGEIEPLEEAQELIHGALTKISTATDARLARVAPELKAWPGIVIHCPDCTQLAWTFDPGSESPCLFCRRAWGHEAGREVAALYAENILGESAYLAAKGRSGWSVSMCPECDEDALVGVFTRESPDGDITQACFQCGFTTTEELGTCGDCGRTTLDPEMSLCPACFSYRMAKD